MSKLFITTQVYENYGAHTHDGKGECPQHWKAKGSGEYVINNFKDFSKVTEVVMALRAQIESNDDFFRETIINYEVVANDFLTEFEKSQLEYDGKIVYSPKVLAW